MAVTVAPAKSTVHWLINDRNTTAWQAMTLAVEVGTEALELDTGQRYYLDPNREWRPWKDPQLEATLALQRELHECRIQLIAIAYGVGLQCETDLLEATA